MERVGRGVGGPFVHADKVSGHNPRPPREHSIPRLCALEEAYERVGSYGD
ncbi:hypothetical protein MA16_Dca027780 [Dendrobium catenatum]|uniref:Uncharacterized protein n=1 Tax=Dendrobium catenatum TaxID=906689 RepID=A0A2I0VB34_9ASPA|nr:hypothetical protein MA16_Dca027780 [Dendrobium catenatum]